MRNLCNERKRLQKQANRANNVIVALIDEHFPEYDEVWEKVTGQTSREIMKRCPCPSDVLETGLEKLTLALRVASNGTEGRVRAEALMEGG